jgi:hypothetical protein
MNSILHPDIVQLLTDLQQTLHAVQTDLQAVHAELKAKPGTPVEPRAAYTVEEAAGLLGKDTYTVRDWCRLGRINAHKRTERRGGSATWGITADEVTRYRNEGLLPIDPSRNTGR